MDEFIKPNSNQAAELNSDISCDTAPENVVSGEVKKVYRSVKASAKRHGISRIGLCLMLALVSAATILIMTFHISYSVSVGEVTIGNIAKSGDLEPIVASAESKVSEVLGYEYTFSDVNAKMVVAPRSEYFDTRAIEKSLINSVDSIVKCYYLEVDGEPVYRSDSYDSVMSLITRLKAPYLNNSECVSVSFAEEIGVQYGYAPTATSTLFNTTYHELSSSLTAEASYQIQYTQEIAFSTEEYNDDTIYEGNSRVTTAGVNGVETITALETYVKGELTETQIVSSTVTSEPITERIAIGTKERPSTTSYGALIWPVSGGGNLTSYFGYRNVSVGSTYHKGIDICASYGTDIFAADGGTVIYSGWMSGYGNLIQVQHDNGSVTYYAHCSSLYVSVGEEVFRGQVIAAIGATGTATANHLHFEVRVGGTAVDPLNYL